MAKITEDYVSYETAKLLVKKGLKYNDAEYESYYTIHGRVIYFKDRPTDINIAPRFTLQTVLKWLRKVHNILIAINGNPSDSLLYINIYKKDLYYGGWVPAESDTSLVYTGETIYEKDFKEYEDACEAAIKYCLEKLI